MKRAVIMGTVAAAFAVAGAAFVAGGIPRSQPLFGSPPIALATAAEAATIYYRDPDGKPFYSLAPKKTADGRDWSAVPASTDLGFDDPEEAPSKTRSAVAKTERRIKYYRNPMGLPDTSPVPKKDSMGMDYIPVYEGDDADDGTVRLSPGKIQRTGAKSEPIVRQPIRSVIRAPGTIQEDERRVSVIALRFEGFVDSVANVTTGDHVHKGQPLMNIYSPALSSAAAEYLSAINAGATGKELKGARRRLENLGHAGAGHQGARTYTGNFALDSLARAAGRRNSRAQRSERHAGGPRRRAVQDRRPPRRLGGARHRGTRPGAGGRPE